VDISKSDLELFQAQLLKSGLAPKTTNDVFTVVRGVWADAFGDGILKGNPLGRITSIDKAGVRHRGANQCRHTFASQALTSDVPVEWAARQLGHSDTTMIKKHYGRWIPGDTRSMAGIVSAMMGFRTAQSGPLRTGKRRFFPNVDP